MGIANPTKTTTHKNVGMGQIMLVDGLDTAGSVLGSCIGLALFDRRRKVACVAHIVLPRSAESKTPKGKFADLAVPEMIAMLASRGVCRNSLNAKLAGGASVLGGKGPIKIGEDNHKTIRNLLDDQKIPVVGEHVGGSKGRRFVFSPDNCDFEISVFGEPVVTI